MDKHCDIVLMGDSVATAFYRMNNTRQIKLDTMINHGISVRKSIKKFVVFDILQYLQKYKRS